MADIPTTQPISLYKLSIYWDEQLSTSGTRTMLEGVAANILLT